MNCETVRENLSDLIDGTLEQPLRFAIENHFQDCQACRDEFETFEKTWSLLDQIPWVEPPEHLHRRIMTAIRTLHSQEEAAAPVPLWRRCWEALSAPIPARASMGWTATAVAGILAIGMIAQVGTGNITMWMSPTVKFSQTTSASLLRAVRVAPAVSVQGNTATVAFDLKNSSSALTVRSYVLDENADRQWAPWMLSSLAPTSSLRDFQTVKLQADGESMVTVPVNAANLPGKVGVAVIRMTSGVSERYLAVFVPTGSPRDRVVTNQPAQDVFSSVIWKVVNDHRVTVMVDGQVDGIVGVPTASNPLECLEALAVQSDLVLDVQPNGIYTLTRKY